MNERVRLARKRPLNKRSLRFAAGLPAGVPVGGRVPKKKRKPTASAETAAPKRARVAAALVAVEAASTCIGTSSSMQAESVVQSQCLLIARAVAARAPLAASALPSASPAPRAAAPTPADPSRVHAPGASVSSAQPLPDRHPPTHAMGAPPQPDRGPPTHAMGLGDMSRLRARKAQLRSELKVFERQFQGLHGGRVPNRSDISKQPHIMKMYTEYHDLTQV